MSEQTLQLILDNLVPLLKGTITGTIPLTLISFVLGLAVALVVALMRLSPVRAVSGAARAYVSVIRGTPLLLQLFIIFYGLPALGVTFDPFPAAVVAFTLAGRDPALIGAVQDSFLSGLSVGCLGVAGICFAAALVGMVALPGRHFHRSAEQEPTYATTSCD